jgi:hypothetical protein
MRSETLKDFIREYAVLFWYSPEDKAETVSDELLVEIVLNYGDMDIVRKLFKIMGVRQAATVFKILTIPKKLNSFPDLK